LAFDLVGIFDIPISPFRLFADRPDFRFLGFRTLGDPPFPEKEIQAAYGSPAGCQTKEKAGEEKGRTDK
jgi:hypothetical protein